MRAWIVALAASLVLSACGKAGPPVAPILRTPAPVADLRGSIEEGAVALTWTIPQQRVDQTRLRDVRETRVYRTEDDGVVPPKPALSFDGRVAGYQQVATIPMEAPAPAVVQGHTISMVDRDGLRFGRRYTYVVLTEDSRGRVSTPSNRLSIMLISPPEAPSAPTVEALDGEVRLRWQPPARLLDGGVPPPLAYEVQRSSAPDAPADTVFPLPVGQTEYVDRSVENERTYYYAVRAILQEAGNVARGPAGARVAATPGRTTPPAPPTNLVATPSSGTVRLSWLPSADPNVATYVIYRADASGTPIRVGSVRAPATTFTDRDLAPGVYRYAVAAQDATARANQSGPSNEVSVNVP